MLTKNVSGADVQCSPEEEAAIRDEWALNAGKVHVPQEVTMRQARLALLAAGKLADVNTAIDAMPEPDRTAARIEWEYSGTVQRYQPLVQALAPALGLTEAQMDDLFKQAAKL